MSCVRIRAASSSLQWPQQAWRSMRLLMRSPMGLRASQDSGRFVMRFDICRSVSVFRHAVMWVRDTPVVAGVGMAREEGSFVITGCGSGPGGGLSALEGN